MLPGKIDESMLAGLAGLAAALNPTVTMVITGSHIEGKEETAVLSNAYALRCDIQIAWCEEGFRRKYTNTMHNGKPLDVNLYVKGKEWRKCELIDQYGTVR
jgi:hypothetical protein